jgi:hypothetical protein
MAVATAPDPRRQLLGRIGGLRAHALHGPDIMLSAAHRGFVERFERQVREAAEDAGEALTPGEVAVRGERLRRSYMLTLAARSAEVRRKKAARMVRRPERPRRPGVIPPNLPQRSTAHLRHEGLCGRRDFCWRPECRVDFRGYRTIEVLPDGEVIAHCHRSRFVPVVLLAAVP